MPAHVRSLRAHPQRRAALLEGTHLDLVRDLRGHLFNVRDDADRAARAAQRLQLLHDEREGVRVQRPEALVDKHCAQLNSSGLGCHDIRQAERERQGRVEGFPARQRARAARGLRVMVDDGQTETRLA